MDDLHLSFILADQRHMEREIRKKTIVKSQSTHIDIL